MSNIPLPQMQRKLCIMGENIKLARLRRKFTVEQVCERADVTEQELTEIEHGIATVSLLKYLYVLRVLNLDGDIYRIAENDALGRKLQDIELLK